MTILEQRLPGGSTFHSVVRLVDNAGAPLRAAAQPSLVQLVLRIALAVPFWRSGIPQMGRVPAINDTALTLFTEEFMLHLPGGLYPLSGYPAPAVMAFLSGSAEIMLPILLVVRLAARFAALV